MAVPPRPTECFCRACVPNEIPSTGTIATCSRCGQEVRLGWRNGVKDWLHREDADHHAILGHMLLQSAVDEWERRRHEVQYTEDGKPYTLVEWERKRMSKKKRDELSAAELDESDDEEEGSDVFEPIEVHRIDLPRSGRLLVGCPDGTVAVAAVPGGARIIINLAKKQGWDVTRLTYSRGPYMGAGGKSLGISDRVVLHVRGPVVDGNRLWGIASWRDGKSDSVWMVDETNQLRHSAAKQLTAWMKETPNTEGELIA